MSKNGFVNERVIDLELNGLKGTVTVPIILTPEQFSAYLKNAVLVNETMQNEKGEGIPAWLARYKVIYPLVLAIDFPGTDMSQFKGDNKNLPFPALVWPINDALTETIANALSVKNLDG